MITAILALIALILTSALWLPLAFIFSLIKLVTTFSLSAAWSAFKSVPIWIWVFVFLFAQQFHNKGGRGGDE